MSVAEAVTLIGAITAAIVSVMTAAVALRNSSRLATVHQLVNSQSEKLVALADAAGHERGVAETLDRPKLPDQPATT